MLQFNTTLAGLAEIDENYDALNKKYNPSHNIDPDALVKFRKIIEAHDCLKQFQCKLQYIKFGSYIPSLGGEGR